jgi:hypothetical protein
MPEAAIDRLEAVEVDEHQRQASTLHGGGMQPSRRRCANRCRLASLVSWSVSASVPIRLTSLSRWRFSTSRWVTS